VAEAVADSDEQKGRETAASTRHNRITAQTKQSIRDKGGGWRVKSTAFRS